MERTTAERWQAKRRRSRRLAIAGATIAAITAAVAMTSFRWSPEILIGSATAADDPANLARVYDAHLELLRGYLAGMWNDPRADVRESPPPGPSKLFWQWRAADAALGMSLPSGIRVGIGPGEFELLGLKYKRHGSAKWSETTFSLPLWMPIAVALMPAAWRAGRRLSRRARPRPGTCIMCGYDLRGSADRCPECGNAIQ